MLSGILFQLFYGILGSWTAYLISILYVEYRTRKEREKVNFRSHVIQVAFISLTNFLKFNCYVRVWCHGKYMRITTTKRDSGTSIVIPNIGFIVYHINFNRVV